MIPFDTSDLFKVSASCPIWRDSVIDEDSVGVKTDDLRLSFVELFSVLVDKTGKSAFGFSKAEIEGLR